MKPVHLWAKVSLFFRCSTYTRSGPLWIGLNLATGQSLAARRWDTPAGYTDLVSVLRQEQAECMAEDIRNASIAKKPADHICHAIPSLSLAGPAATPKDSGQFGLVLDAEMVATLDGIAPNDMAWLTTPERNALHTSFSRLNRDQIDALAWSVIQAGFPITITPAADQIRFEGKRLDEITA